MFSWLCWEGGRSCHVYFIPPLPPSIPSLSPSLSPLPPFLYSLPFFPPFLLTFLSPPFSGKTVPELHRPRGVGRLPWSGGRGSGAPTRGHHPHLQSRSARHHRLLQGLCHCACACVSLYLCVVCALYPGQEMLLLKWNVVSCYRDTQLPQVGFIFNTCWDVLSPA